MFKPCPDSLLNGHVQHQNGNRGAFVLHRPCTAFAHGLCTRRCFPARQPSDAMPTPQETCVNRRGAPDRQISLHFFNSSRKIRFHFDPFPSFSIHSSLLDILSFFFFSIHFQVHSHPLRVLSEFSPSPLRVLSFSPLLFLSFLHFSSRLSPLVFPLSSFPSRSSPVQVTVMVRQSWRRIRKAPQVFKMAPLASPEQPLL